MQKITKPKVDLFELIETLDIDFESIRFFVDKLTGKIVTWSEEGGFVDMDIDDDETDDEESDDEETEDEDFDDEFIPDHYIPLPDRWDLDKYRIMEDFCCSIEDVEIQHNLLSAIRGKGAFGRFNTAIRCYKIENDWFKYLHENLKEVAIEFCKVHHLDYEYCPPDWFIKSSI